ncbi:hypothetical protein DES40_2210 [Litorimonas taeanensis]|uniref:Uncharacterized protein n=1 Tax=Litorimonas taeanensis TaxID=568099 RepID=A0A420WEM0_9PROT|nr:hypothetical protein [Litorimonas taeanensis]RKQ69410.1 hypothetical protein DES40_2210 [Litorimonas taeanensis]
MTNLRSDDTLTYQQFDNPSDIVDASTLSAETKEALLTQWVEDEEALTRASNEGLNGGERPHLRAAQAALLKLKEG